MFYLNDNLTKQDWIRISALSNNTKKRNINNNNRIVVPKIEKVSLHKINTSSSSSSLSLFSSISSNLINNSKYIYKKRQNKSRNYLNINNNNNNNSSSESLFKLEQNHKKRKQKLNKLIDNLDNSTKYNNNSTKPNHYEQQQKRHIRSRSSRDSSRQLKQQQRSTSSELYSLSHNYEKIINNNDLFKNDVLKYNSYGLIRLIPSKLTRPSLPPHCAHKYLFIVPPAKHNRAILVNAAQADNAAIFTSSRSNSYSNYLNRTKRSRSSPKISVFYSVEYESPDEFTANSIVETLSKTISNTKILDENLNTIRVKTKIR
jgi:hypothetical protein